MVRGGRMLLGVVLGVVVSAVSVPAGARPAFSQAADTTKVERRLALVIGNATYKNSPLKNAANDARLMADALKTRGFDVLRYENIGQKEMKKAVIEFGRRLQEAGGVGLFYFAGHGMQVAGRNFMIPIDAEIRSEAEVETESVEVGSVLARMETAKNRLNIVVLDACRDNPFGRSFRSASRGLASIDAPSGTMIAYATAPGRVAADGDGANGPYSAELARAMAVTGLKIEDVFKRVRVAVQQQTRGDQVPWESSSLTGDFYFTPGAAPAVAVGGADGGSAGVEVAYWNSIKDSSNPTLFREYVQKYPNGSFRSLALNRVDELERPKRIDSAEIARTVRQRLGEKGLSLNVDVNAEGVVTLTGVVKTQDQKTLASGLARVPGVTDVRAQINVQDRWRLQ
jgi:hypothetical protein